ncbi:DUF2474 domain-containing protein [Azoarcus sp. DD4]|nr:DUF2474 domain-containing protein [Azoarcus sp. DD4]QDF97828.1 DUF2474 domain-containing protein [Azoarcus sp. DD4]
MDSPSEERRASHLGRLGWLVVIWAASVAALGVVAWLIRQLMGLAGLSL